MVYIPSGNKGFGGGVEEGAWESTPLGKILRVLGTGERIGAKYALTPIMEALQPGTRERLGNLKGDIYAGDVLRAALPHAEKDFFTNALFGAGGVALGAAVDPLSYGVGPKGIGQLTQRGRQIAPLARLAEAPSMAAEAEKGYRALLQPFGKTLVRGTPVFKALDVVKGGKLFESTVGSVPPLRKVAQGLDTFYKSAFNKFGADIGIDPWLSARMRQYYSNIAGYNKRTVEELIVSLDPKMQDLAKETSAILGMSHADALKHWDAVTREVLESHPWIVSTRAAGSKKFSFRQQPLDVSLDTPESVDRAIKQVMSEMPLPVSLGGPGSIYEPSIMRKAREYVIEAKAHIRNVTQAQQDGLDRKIRLWSDGNYLYHLGAPEFKEAINDYFKVAGRKALYGIGGGGRPTEQQLMLLSRRFRIVNGPGAQELIQAGELPQTVKIKVRRRVKGRVRETMQTVNLHDEIAKTSGRMAPSKVRRGIMQLYNNGELSADQVGKVLPTMSGEQANAWIREFGLGPKGKEWIKPGQIQNAFATDPTQIVTARGVSANRALLSKQFYDEIKGMDRIALPVKEAGKIPGTESFRPVMDIPELHGYAMHPEAIDHLRRLTNADIYTTEHLHKFYQSLHGANRWFKSWVLAIFPAYHSRNAVSNQWQYFMAGNADPITAVRGMKDSHQLLHAVRKGRGSSFVFKTPNGTMTGDEIFRAVVESNGFGVGFLAPDNPRKYRDAVKYLRRHGPDNIEGELRKIYVEQGLGKKWRNLVAPPDVATRIKEGLLEIPSPENNLIQTGYKFGSLLDEQIRMSHILNRLRKGDDLNAAIMDMKKFFYDYSDLSPFERDVMRAFIPFYTWSRKNIPFYLESLVARPWQVARFGGFLQGYTGFDNPSQEKEVTQYLKKNFGVRVRKNAKTGMYEYFVLKNWLPLADIHDLFNIWDFARQGLTPFARVPLELAFNYNFHTHRKINRLAENVWESLATGERTTHYSPLTGLPPSKKLGFPGIKTGIKPSAGVQHILNSFRLTQTIHNMVDNPQELSTVNRLLSLAAGRFYPLNTQKSLFEAEKDLLELEQNLMRSLRRNVFTNEPPEEMIRYMDIYNKKFKKTLKKHGR